jgi:peptide/nickel transport system substrate-binding protein
VKVRQRGRGRIAVALGVLLAVVLTWGVVSAVAASVSPSPSGSPSSAPGKLVLRVGWTSDPDNLNPFIGYESSSFEVWGLNYDLLVGFRSKDMGNPSGDAATGLATEWTHTPDGKTWTFTLRSGVMWQDGVPLTAKDVAWTFNFIINPDNNAGNFSSYTTFIDSVVALDDTHVQFNCSKPKANMLGLWIPILPEHVWGKLSAKAITLSFQNPAPIIGSGPFQTVERVPGKYIRMVKNPNYWRGAPKIDEVIFENYSNPDSMAADLKTNTIQAAWNIPLIQFDSLNKPPTTAIKAEVVGFDELAFNCYDNKDSLGNPVLRDPAFRQALNYAVDKQKIATVAYQGFAIPGETIITHDYYAKAPVNWEWTPPTPYTFDLTKAGDALTAAGYPLKNGVRVDKQGKPIKLRLWARSRSLTGQSAGSFIAGWFKSLGLNIQYSVMDDGAIGDKILNTNKAGKLAPDYDMFLWGWGGDVDPNFILSIFLTSQIGSWSDCGWSNAEYDKLFEQQQTTIDPQARKQIIDRMQQIVYEQSPYIITAYPLDVDAFNSQQWAGWVRSPEGKGGVIYNTLPDTYLFVHLKSSEPVAAKSSSATVWIVVIVVVAAVVIAAVVWLLVRRRERSVEET